MTPTTPEHAALSTAAKLVGETLDRMTALCSAIDAKAEGSPS